jgi:Uma2 family endonuclease
MENGARKMEEENKKWTIAEYEALDDGNRYELYDGELVLLASPSEVHQRASRKLSTKLDLFFGGKSCEPFAAPMDVKLFENEETMLQPDLFVICDSDRRNTDTRYIDGVPKLVVEILSPSTESRDRWKKMRLYQRAGVKEYIIVDLEIEMIQNICFDEVTTLQIVTEDSEQQVFETVFDGLSISLSEILD